MTPQDITRRLADGLGLADAATDRLSVAPGPTALATWMPIADIAAAAQGLVGLAAEAMHRARGGPAQSVAVDRRAASLSMTASAYLTVDGRKVTAWDPLTGYFPSADGWVYTHCQFPHLRDRLLAAFGLPNDREAYAAALARLPGPEIEDRAAAAGVCAIMRRDRATWDAHPQAAVLADQQVVRLDRFDGPAGGPAAEARAPEARTPEARTPEARTPETRPIQRRAPGPAGEAPLSGIRVLDLSRVIAGPMMGRTLAEHGAEVLRIGSPNLPFFEALVINTGYGKRSANIDLETAAGREALARLVADADVVIDGYRPGALARHGFGFDALRSMNPGIVYLTLSAFGETGPWGGRRGYDTYVQGATGLSADGPGGPERLPCQPLDYLSGYLGAAAAMIALRRRIEEGGAWRVELVLARTAMWLWEMTDLLPAETDPPEANPSIEAVAPYRDDIASAFGQLSAMRPAVSLSDTPPRWRSPPVPLGTHPAAWAAG